MARHPKSTALLAQDAENQHGAMHSQICQSACAHKLTTKKKKKICICLYSAGYLPPCGLLQPTADLSSKHFHLLLVLGQTANSSKSSTGSTTQIYQPVRTFVFVSQHLS